MSIGSYPVFGSDNERGILSQVALIKFIISVQNVWDLRPNLVYWLEYKSCQSSRFRPSGLDRLAHSLELSSRVRQITFVTGNWRLFRPQNKRTRCLAKALQKVTHVMNTHVLPMQGLYCTVLHSSTRIPVLRHWSVWYAACYRATSSSLQFLVGVPTGLWDTARSTWFYYIQLVPRKLELIVRWWELSFKRWVPMFWLIFEE